MNITPSLGWHGDPVLGVALVGEIRYAQTAHSPFTQVSDGLQRPSSNKQPARETENRNESAPQRGDRVHSSEAEAAARSPAHTQGSLRLLFDDRMPAHLEARSSGPRLGSVRGPASPLGGHVLPHILSLPATGRGVCPRGPSGEKLRGVNGPSLQTPLWQRPRGGQTHGALSAPSPE